MNGLRAALTFLTVLPVGGAAEPWRPGAAAAWFPMVGLALGGTLALVDMALDDLLGIGPTSALLVVMLAGMTRALHLDGLMDCCDALFGGYTRERRLEILKDSRVGAFAVVGGAGALLLAASAISALPFELRAPVLVVFPALGRWGIVMCMALFPLATENTTARSFKSSHMRRNAALALVTVGTASVLLAGPLGLALLAAGTALAWLVARWASGLLGGVTGDVYGAVDKVVEIAALLLAVGLYRAWPELFAPVLPGLA